MLHCLMNIPVWESWNILSGIAHLVRRWGGGLTDKALVFSVVQKQWINGLLYVWLNLVSCRFRIQSLSFPVVFQTIAFCRSITRVIILVSGHWFRICCPTDINNQITTVHILTGSSVFIHRTQDEWPYGAASYSQAQQSLSVPCLQSNIQLIISDDNSQTITYTEMSSMWYLSEIFLHQY